MIAPKIMSVLRHFLSIYDQRVNRFALVINKQAIRVVVTFYKVRRLT